MVDLARLDELIAEEPVLINNLFKTLPNDALPKKTAKKPSADTLVGRGIIRQVFKHIVDQLEFVIFH